ncbi:hypothetical protein [Streptomyces sp. NBC_01240]|uniref:hypothetical protein n=1 Tax=Streptomyces sp. NBC_01240 TaxID=2903793 RepID=UPI002E0D581A|nr:hypothetical protein OG466_39200 [Streptomyces sp. NBC_01240]
MSRASVPLLALLFATLLAGCSSPSPAEAGEEYGSTIRHGDAQVTCIVQSLKEYDDEQDTHAFFEACKERAER